VVAGDSDGTGTAPEGSGDGAGAAFGLQPARPEHRAKTASVEARRFTWSELLRRNAT